MEVNADEGLVKVSKFLAKAVVGLAPGGGTVAEIIELVVGNPADRRRDRYLQSISERLEALEDAGLINLNELAADERVSAILLQSVQAATRAQSEQKREALRNAALGGTCIDSNRALASVVISNLDDLTDLHLYVVDQLAELARRHSGAATAKPGYIEGSSLRHHILQRAFGTDQGITEQYYNTHEKLAGVPDPDSEEYKIVFADLVRSGLIDDVKDEDDVWERRHVRLTALGNLIRRYIGDGIDLIRQSEQVAS